MNTTTTARQYPARQAARRTSAKTVRLLAIVMIVLLAGGGAYWYIAGRKAPASDSVTYTSTVERGDIQVTATGQGTLVTREAVNMAFSTSGRVAEVAVKLGDMVKKGDVLARLEKAADLEVNLAAAQANLLQAQQDLEALQKKGGSTLAMAYQDFLSAQDAYNDMLAASQRTAYTRCSKEMMDKYASALEAATQKINELYLLDSNSAQTTIARYDYDTALANYNYCAAYIAVEKTSAGANLEIARSTLEEAQNEYETLKDASGVDPDKLSLYETRLETAQTQVDTAQEAVDGTTLTASMDGRITYLAGDAGTIAGSATFLTISDVRHPTVTISLDETDMYALVVGYPATVTFTALPGQSFTGKVSLANPEMFAFGPFRAASGQVELDDAYSAQFESLPLGMSATVIITSQFAQGVLLAPADALTEQRNGEYTVDLVGSDGQIVQQVVTIGLQNDTIVEITSGLKEGDRISITKKVDDIDNPFGGEMPPGGAMPPMP